jgi:hypothetical protein
MNDTFSLQRFGLLLKKFIKEHTATYLLYIAILFGIILVVYGLTTLSVLQGRFPSEAPVIYFVMGSILMAGMFSSSFYSFFHNKAKGIQYLNLPSSHTEKLLVGFLFTQIVFFVIYVAVFFVVDQMMVGIYNKFHKMPGNVSPEYLLLYKASPIDFNNPEIFFGLLVAYIVSAVSHFGSLCFEKNAFVKTALICIVGSFALVFYSYYGMKSIIPEEIMPNGTVYNTSMRVGEDPIKGIVYLPGGWSKFITWFLPVMAYVLFWSASYFKLKEKQV